MTKGIIKPYLYKTDLIMNFVSTFLSVNFVIFPAQRNPCYLVSDGGHRSELMKTCMNGEKDIVFKKEKEGARK